jgi:hypothetical protein
MSQLTQDQQKGLNQLLSLIQTTHALIANGLFPGVASAEVAKVLGWLGQYHRDVKAQLPTEASKDAPKASEVTEGPIVAPSASCEAQTGVECGVGNADSKAGV